MRLPITSYALRSEPASSSELVNCYVEKLPEDARAPYLIRRSPGVIGSSSSGTTSNKAMPIIGAGYWRGDIYVAKHNSGYLQLGQLRDPISTNLALTHTDTSFAGGSLTKVDFAANAANLVAVAEPQGHYFDGSSWTQISDGDFTSRGAGDVEFLDNFLLYREPRSGRFFGSDVGSVSAYDPLNFATTEASPDDLVGMKADKAQIVLLNESTTEIWDTTGGSGFPFRPVINGAISIGCGNGNTAALVNNRVCWLADDGTVRMLQGLEATRISNHGIEQNIKDDRGFTSSAVGYAYNWDGHYFYQLWSPEQCLIYDMTTGLWHKRRSIGKTSWRWGTVVQTPQGRVYMGDRLGRSVKGSSNVKSGSAVVEYGVAELTNDTHWDQVTSSASLVGYQPEVMSWTYQTVFASGQRVFHNRLEIVCQTGVGTSSTEPIVNLEVSDDGGQTYTHMPTRSIGAVGERYQRLVWDNLGSSYQRVYRASISDDVPVTITDTLLDAEGGSV